MARKVPLLPISCGAWMTQRFPSRQIDSGRFQVAARRKSIPSRLARLRRRTRVYRRLSVLIRASQSPRAAWLNREGRLVRADEAPELVHLIAQHEVGPGQFEC